MLKTLLTNILPRFASIVRNPTHPQILSYSFDNQQNQSLHTPKSFELKNKLKIIQNQARGDEITKPNLANDEIPLKC
jgi:hypothetical protein